MPAHIQNLSSTFPHENEILMKEGFDKTLRIPSGSGPGSFDTTHVLRLQSKSILKYVLTLVILINFRCHIVIISQSDYQVSQFLPASKCSPGGRNRLVGFVSWEEKDRLVSFPS